MSRNLLNPSGSLGGVQTHPVPIAEPLISLRSVNISSQSTCHYRILILIFHRTYLTVRSRKLQRWQYEFAGFSDLAPPVLSQPSGGFPEQAVAAPEKQGNKRQ